MNDKIGILDISGENINPLTNNVYSEKYKELAKIWSKFPAYEKAHEIINAIKENQVILITSGTGSGKTVLLPKFCLHALNYDCKIAVTLPKQIIAKSAAEFAAKTLDVNLGEEVGYKYKDSEKSGLSSKTKLLFATDGTIVAKLMKDQNLEEYDAIIIDEAHERKVQIDFLLYLLKNVCVVRPKFKLIIMSATVNVNVFSNYFSNFLFLHFDIGGATNYPIKSIFLDKPISQNDYLATGIKIIKNILETTKDGDILFFVTSVNETFNSCKKITDNKTYCVEVFAGTNEKNQELAQHENKYKEITKKNRKVVIATNVAESSLTISNIKFVVDSGYELMSYYDPNKYAKVLEKKLISRAQATQRMGRAGRTSSGTCYHLYTKNDFDNMIEYPLPSIKTSDITGECMRLLNLDNILTVDKLNEIFSKFIEPPDTKYVKSSLTTLMSLGIIEKNELTEMGKKIANMNLEPLEGICIYNSYKTFCLKEVITIFSMINIIRGNINELFIVPNKENIQLYEKYNKAKKSLGDKHGDHISLLKIFVKYLKLKENDDELNEWLHDNFLKKNILDKTLSALRRTRGQVIKSLHIDENKIDSEEYENINSVDMNKRILEVIKNGYELIGNVIHQNAKDNKYHNRIVNDVNVSNDSWIINKKSIMYNELIIINGKCYATINSAI